MDLAVSLNTLTFDDANSANNVITRSLRKKRKSDVNTRMNGDAQQKKKTMKGKAKAGRLEGLVALPMDVLFEILGHLLPLDILHLARTTKEFRRILLHKSSISVWKSARTNVLGLPEISPTMSEPEYANLAFDQHCHVCLARNTRTIEWRLRLRICSKCSKTQLVEIPVFHSVYDIVLTRPSKPHRELCYIEDLKAVQHRLMSLDDVDLRNAYYKDRKDFVQEVINHAMLCEVWATTTKVSRSQELEEIRQDRKKAIMEKLTDLGWGYEIEQLCWHNDLGRHALVKQPTRLSDRIWKNIKAPLVRYMEDMKVIRIKRERQDLVFSRKRVAIGILRAYKISHLPFIEVMPEPVDFCTFPEVQAVLELPNDIDVSESSFSGIVPLLPTIVDRWRAGIIQKFAARVRQAHEDERPLLGQAQAPASENAMPQSTDESPHELIKDATDDESPAEVEYDPVEKMKLATTVFKCRKCGERYHNWPYRMGNMELACHRPPPIIGDVTYPLFYPQVLGHRCLTQETTDPPVSYYADPSLKLNFDDSPFVNCNTLRHRQNWDCSCLAVDSTSGERVAKIITTCGLDPATTTAEDMDKLDPRVGCPNCVEVKAIEPDVARLMCFGWREALHHQNSDHYGDEIDWLILGDGALSLAREVEKQMSDSCGGEDPDIDELDPPSGLVVWMCVHCLDLPSQKSPRELYTVKDHIRDCHNIDNPQLDIDYYKDYEAPQGCYTDMPNKVALLGVDIPKREESEDL